MKKLYKIAHAMVIIVGFLMIILSIAGCAIIALGSMTMSSMATNISGDYSDYYGFGSFTGMLSLLYGGVVLFGGVFLGSLLIAIGGILDNLMQQTEHLEYLVANSKTN